MFKYIDNKDFSSNNSTLLCLKSQMTRIFPIEMNSRLIKHFVCYLFTMNQSEKWIYEKENEPFHFEISFSLLSK